jgi:chromosomal replication initiator protein
MAEPNLTSADLWQDFLGAVENKLSSHVLETWLRPVRCSAFDGKTVTLEVRDQFFRDWLTDHYLDFIREGLTERAGHKVGIAWTINPEMRPPVEETVSEAPIKVLPPSMQKRPAAPKKLSDADHDFDREPPRQLNKRYLFDSFVCGPSNQFAFAACKAVAENPGLSYNPLFIFGGVGLGKTHLLSAIGHRILQDRPGANVIYTSSEQFTNEVINAVLGSKLEHFQRKYRNNCDVILMDDIQLIAGKERTQHEFFHIFNRLYDSQRQIVVTSDKLPHEIPEIEERLRNRFQWGLIADIQPPEIETRVAILRKKAINEGFALSNDVAFFLAKNIRSNVRELEGALVRVMAHASLTGTVVTVDYVRNTLGDIISNRGSQLTVENIQKIVASFFEVRVTDLKSRRRLATLMRPRQVAMYLCRKHTDASYPDLGGRFGNKDHTTIMSACTRIDEQLRIDPALRAQVQDLERQLDFNQQ